MEAFLMAFIRLQNVHKSFGDFEALRGIDLEVEKGENIAIIGPSGCGKTTLLRCLALFEKIDKGAIYLNEEPVITAEDGKQAKISVGLNAWRTQVGMVFQHLNIWPHLSILDNVTLASRVVRKVDKKEADEKGMELLGKMGIADQAKKLPQALSGGQLQRVALARAIMMDPEILLLDEITSALDPELVGEVLDIIAELTDGGMTTFIITHEMAFASEVADRVVFVNDGTIVESGTPKQIFKHPKTDRLKAFLLRITRHQNNLEIIL
jgi:polar amino acid transport system ATP-binding protein